MGVSVGRHPPLEAQSMSDADPPEQTSPAGEHLGRKVVSADPESGEFSITYVARPEFANRNGTVAGGFLAAMLDSATAIPALQEVAPGQSLVTTDLSLNFERPARVGLLAALSRVLSRSNGEIRSSGELRDESGRILARATATLRIVG
jgi:uncharacterized protein (TIGR00369 family)